MIRACVRRSSRRSPPNTLSGNSSPSLLWSLLLVDAGDDPLVLSSTDDRRHVLRRGPLRCHARTREGQLLPKVDRHGVLLDHDIALLDAHVDAVRILEGVFHAGA